MSGAAVDVEVRVSALRAAVADLADLAWGCVPVDVADAVLADLEVAQRTLKAVGYAAINRVKDDDDALGRGRRLRDHLANDLHLSATEAGSRIATAVDVAGEHPTLL